MVKLAYDKLEKPQEFELSHAQRILNMKNNGGWKLVDSKFILDDNGDIKRKTTGSN